MEGTCTRIDVSLGERVVHKDTVWDHHSGRRIHSLCCQSTTLTNGLVLSGLLAMKMSNGGPHLLVAAFGPLLCYWDIDSGKELQQVETNHLSITIMCSLKEPELFATGGEDP